jgi:N-carbamoylputrescine amidase
VTRPNGAFRFALVQRCSAPFDAAGNRTRSVEDVRTAFADGADVVLLPELVVPGYALDRDRLVELGEELDGPTVTAWTHAAADADGLVIGGLCERAGDRLYNTALIVGAAGVVAHYRKLHLFGREKHIFAPGDLGLPVVDTPFGMLGLCVCYDLRFVEVVRAMALRGADVIAVPTAWVGGFDARLVAPGEVCRQAQGALLQANLSQVFIACASQSGRHAELRFLGNSLVADPYGDPVRPPLSSDAEAVVTVDVDLAAVAAAQQRGPLITPRADRRTDVYGLWYRDAIL